MTKSPNETAKMSVYRRILFFIGDDFIGCKYTFFSKCGIVGIKEKTKLDHAKRSEIKHSRDPIERMMERQWRRDRRRYRREERSSKFKSVKDNTFLLEINPDVEVVDVHFRFVLSGEEDGRMSAALYHIIDSMPRWTLNHKMSQPADMIFQEYPYRILR